MTLRRAAVAGTWYPATAAALTREVESYLASSGPFTDAVPHDADIVALVSPHAGLQYSGPVAACAYDLLRRQRYQCVVLVGPSHYVGFEGASIWRTGAFDTPLGAMKIDEATAERICAASAAVVDYPRAHLREHSIEMQLPFLAALVPQVPIVPIVMGLQTRETAFAVGDAIAEALRGEQALIVASSDLSHFHDAATAASLDGRVIAHVDAADPDGLMQLLEERADHACGGGPMVSVLRAARSLGATNSKVLRYADSGDVSGDKTSVVGYMAAALWR